MPNIIKQGMSGEGVSQYSLNNNLFELARQMTRGENSEETSETVEVKTQEMLHIESALKRSEEILHVAREEARKIKEEAYEEAYQSGMEKGEKDGYHQAYQEHEYLFSQEREAILQEIKISILEMEGKKQELLDSHLEDLKNISIAIAEKVMRVSLQNSGDIIKRMIIASTEKLSKVEWANIYISKYDAQLLIEGDTKLLHSLSFLSDNIKVIPMEKEERGTCIVELPKEVIDASINTQMENIRNILSNVQL